jgi:hypothetical protein
MADSATPFKEEPMGLMELVLLACSLSNPGTCHEYHLVFQTAESLRSCTMEAEPYLAQWIGEHPNLRVARWRCASPEEEGRKT